MAAAYGFYFVGYCTLAHCDVFTLGLPFTAVVSCQVCLTFHPEGSEWAESEPVLVSEGFLGSTAGQSPADIAHRKHWQLQEAGFFGLAGACCVVLQVIAGRSDAWHRHSARHTCPFTCARVSNS